MRIQILILFLTISFGESYGQTADGKYFENITGTVWTSSEYFTDSTMFQFKKIGLALLESSTDSIKQNTMVWIFFTDSLTIKYYNSTSNQFMPILSCTYTRNKENRTITLHSDHLKHPEIIYSYMSVSTGSYVVLTGEKSKIKNR